MTTQELNVVGQSIQRRDGQGHVTGKTIYVDDIKFRDMLHLKMVRSPYPMPASRASTSPKRKRCRASCGR